MIPRQTYSRAFIFSSSHTPRTRSRHAFRAASRKPASRAGRAKLRRATLCHRSPELATQGPSPLPVVRENVISCLHDRGDGKPPLGAVRLRRLSAWVAGVNVSDAASYLNAAH